ncbi:dual specificity protein phosphatase 13-like isoform X3 [Gouania willdenowi]|uniref:dual specificity protein phosphatase 13-like isoform X3 n=1 Tax=Gouania willdenowi TaxID=441366 RepID=UPI001056BBFA|nr:dual specificity protein phosphatase 13-like isoform X3 [Gouania willdenowi]
MRERTRQQQKTHRGRTGRSHLSRSWWRFYIQLQSPVVMAMRFLSHDKFGLYQLGITHVLNASHGKLCCKGNEDFYGTTVKYYGVAANDLPTFDLSPFFYPAAEFIHHALTSGGRILVHCAVGVSRSAALVLAYLMIYHHLSLVSSVRCVQQKRWICPNRGFLRQLIGLDKKLREQSVNVLMQH